jgi:glycosyltransferase involved in cell wall biosynthesis
VEILFQHRAIQCANAIYFTTEGEKRLSLPCIFQTPGVVVPIGLDINEYGNLPVQGTFRSQHPETIGKKIVLFFGRINFTKGLDILISAFSKIAKMQGNVHLIIAGPDNEGFGKKVREWLKEKEVFNRSTFTGMLLGNDKLALLRDADLFVLPSYTENFGVSVVEAMACEVPVIISDKVNIWREVVAGGAGKVVPCDPDRFAKAMSELLEDVSTTKQMGVQGKLLVKERFQWSKVAFAMEDVYRSIISQNISV